jgi:proprotein convertase subtilisin/kexin type 5
LTCASTLDKRNTQNVCDCIDHYYETHLLATGCAICDYKCGNCVDKSTKCTTCSDLKNRSLIPVCLCDDGWWDDNTPTCKVCDYQCSTCVDNADKCKTCSHSTRDLSKNCACEDGTYDVGVPEC